MGQAFSGPNAFKFFGFTPKATAVLAASPILFLTLVLALLSMGILVGVAYLIHWQTNKVYYKPKPKKEVKGDVKK
jgi:uncharacterized membrane protein